MSRDWTQHQVRHFAESLRSMLIDAHMRMGDDFGKALARRCAWEIGDVSTDIHGREFAFGVLDSAATAIAGGIPLQEPPAVAPPPVTRAEMIEAINQSLFGYSMEMRRMGLNRLLEERWYEKAWRKREEIIERYWNQIAGAICATMFLGTAIVLVLS